MCEILNTGTSSFSVNGTRFHLSRILHVPHICKNLLSVNRFTNDNNVCMEFHPHHLYVKDRRTGRVLLHSRSKGELYQLNLGQPQPPPAAMIGEKASVDVWHARLGHPSLHIVQQILSRFGLPSLSNKGPYQVCEACAMSKSHKLPFVSSHSKSTGPLDLIFSDVWGPSPVASHNGYRYSVHFPDDYSKYTWVFPMMNKSDVCNIFYSFRRHVEKYFGRPIKAVHSDWGREYCSLSRQLKAAGILHRLSCPHTPEQNGAAEGSTGTLWRRHYLSSLTPQSPFPIGMMQFNQQFSS